MNTHRDVCDRDAGPGNDLKPEREPSYKEWREANQELAALRDQQFVCRDDDTAMEMIDDAESLATVFIELLNTSKLAHPARGVALRLLQRIQSERDSQPTLRRLPAPKRITSTVRTLRIGDEQ